GRRRGAGGGGVGVRRPHRHRGAPATARADRAGGDRRTRAGRPVRPPSRARARRVRGRSRLARARRDRRAVGGRGRRVGGDRPGGGRPDVGPVRRRPPDPGRRRRRSAGRTDGSRDMTGANSLDDLTEGALAVWRLAAAAAERAGVVAIEPIHLLIGACRFAAGDAAVAPAEADAVRARFAAAGVDPANYAHRLVRLTGSATRLFGADGGRPELSAAAQAQLSRARGAVRSAYPGGRTGADDLLQSLLAAPAPPWVRVLADRAGPLAVERLRSAAGSGPTVLTSPHVRLDVHDGSRPVRTVRFTGPARWVVGRSPNADLQ